MGGAQLSSAITDPNQLSISKLRSVTSTSKVISSGQLIVGASASIIIINDGQESWKLHRSVAVNVTGIVPEQDNNRGSLRLRSAITGMTELILSEAVVKLSQSCMSIRLFGLPHCNCRKLLQSIVEE